MNDDTYTPCTNCGRPMKYCKGQCCGKPQGCDCKEYGPAVCGVIRQRQPECPYTAVIPSMVVEHADNLKDLCDTFVHVSDLNTTFYIDDKHRTIITWAGPVEYDNYDLAANSLGLRSQFLLDFANDRGAYYDKTGNYKVFNFGNGGSGGDCCNPRHFTPGYTEGNYQPNSGGPMIREINGGVTSVKTWELPIVSFSDQESGDSYTLAETFQLLENGENIVFDNIPVGYHDGYPTDVSYCDGITLPVHALNEHPYGHLESFAGTTFVFCPAENASATVGVALAKEYKADGSVNRYVFTSQGFTYVGPPR